MINYSTYGAALSGACALVILIFSVRRVRVEHPYLVFTLWYLCSLSFCIIGILISTLLIADKIGVLKDSTDKLLSATVFALSFMIDLRMELIIITAALILLVVPQFLSYIVSGLFGCGSQPKFVTGTAKLLYWSFAKSLALCSGAILALAVGQIFENRGNLQWGMLDYFATSLLSIAVSFLMALVYYYSGLEILFQNRVSQSNAFVSRADRWLRRFSDRTEVDR